MASVSVYQVINNVVNGAVLANQVHKLATTQPQPNESRKLDIAATIFQGMAYTANACALGAEFRGASDKTILQIKSAELMCHVAHVPTKMTKAAMDYSNGNANALECIREGVLAPLASASRAEEECTRYGLKHQLTLPPEKRSHKPVYNDKGDLVDWKPLTKKELKKEIAKTEREIKKSIVLEVASKIPQCIQVYQAVLSQISALPPQPPQNPPAANNAAAVDPLDINLVDLPFIPQGLHNDAIFSRFQCPITLIPIRDPVGDPNGVTVYERTAIVDWINAHGNSPMTRQPLHVNQLVPRPMLRALIDQRLAMHQQLMQQAVQAGLANAAPNNVLQPAEAENPQL